MTLFISRRQLLCPAILAVVTLGFLHFGTTPCPAAETVQKATDKKINEIPAVVRQAEESSKTLKQQFQTAESQAKQAAEQIAASKHRLTELDSEIPALTKSISEVEKRLTTEQAAAAKAQADKEKADKEKADAAQKLATETAEKAKKTELELQELKSKSNAAVMEKTQAAANITKNEQVLKTSTELAKKSREAWNANEQKIQQLLIDAGLWVSFSRDIAPLFAKRCQVCHNAKKSDGDFSLESYSAMTDGGESGTVIDHSNLEDSLLSTLIADGSMPKDSDPLSAAEISLIKRWVLTGARIDNGVKADAKLIEIMPRSVQPAAPASYRAPMPVTALAFSPDGKTLASSGYHEVQIWSVEKPELLRRISNVAERVYNIEFSPDGKLIAVAAGTPGQLGEIKVFNAADGALAADLLISSEVQLGLAFNSDGTLLATCGADHKVRIFNLNTKLLQLEIEPHLDWVTDVKWSPDGKSLLTCGLDKTVKILNASTGIAIVTFNGHTDFVTTATYLPEGTQVISAGRDKVLRVWNVSDASEVRKITGSGGEVSRVVALPDQQVLSAGLDKVTRVHNFSDGKLVRNFTAQPQPLFALAAHVASGLVATGSQNGEIQIWNLSDGKALRKWSAMPSDNGGQSAKLP